MIVSLRAVSLPGSLSFTLRPRAGLKSCATESHAGLEQLHVTHKDARGRWQVELRSGRHV